MNKSIRKAGLPSVIGAAEMEAVKLSFDDPSTVLVDVRSDEPYNGWSPMEGIKGGHIQGAVHFPLEWLDSELSDDEKRTLLEKKGITMDKTIMTYCNMGKDSLKFAENLIDFGYTNVNHYKGGMKEWGADDTNEVAALPNYDRLVSVEWVNDLTSDKKPTKFDGDNYVILETNHDDEEYYKAGHIKDAIYFNTREIEGPVEGPSWNVIPDAELEALLAAYGITRDTTVLVYGKLSMGAYRTAVALMYAGVADVRIINGGKDRWVEKGYQLDKEHHQPVAIAQTDIQVPANPGYIINIPEAKALLEDENGVMVAIKTWEEFIGGKSSYTYYSRTGRIPGAVFGDCGVDAYDMSVYEDFDGTMRSYTEIQAKWDEIGVTPDKKVSFYCGGGWRASATFFAAYMMGYEEVSVFDDGWFGWSLDPSNPIEAGMPAQ